MIYELFFWLLLFIVCFNIYFFLDIVTGYYFTEGFIRFLKRLNKEFDLKKYFLKFFNLLKKYLSFTNLKKLFNLIFKRS